MRTRTRKSSLQRYRNLPMDAVLALLYEGREEDGFGLAHSRREKRQQ